MKSRKEKRSTEKMSDKSFKGMTFIFKVVDTIFPYINRRIKKFNVKKGMTIVDYGCGPGRYTIRFAKKVGTEGKVYAVDIHEMAIRAVEEKIKKYGLKNIETKLAKGYENGVYDTGLQNDIADMVCALDMFFIIKEPTEFLNEIKRILKKDGVLVIDDGHQSRKETKRKIGDSGIWKIAEETRDHLKCKLLSE